MEVEHYDSRTQMVTVLAEDHKYARKPVTDDPAVLYDYWNLRHAELSKQFTRMTRTKERQQVALERDRASMERNRWAHLAGIRR